MKLMRVKTREVGVALLSTILAVLFLAPILAAQGTGTLVFHKAVDGYSIDAYDANYGVSEPFLTLRITPPSGPVHSMTLDRRSRKVTDVFVQGQSRAIVTINSSVAQIVTIVDLASWTELDKFLCYEASVSPDSHMVAFKKFFPSNHPVGPALYLAYDVTLSPAANRMSATESEADAGWAFYPDQNRQQLTYDLSLFNATNQHLLRSPLTWIDNSHLAFIDYSNEKTNAVMVNLMSGVASPVVSTQLLDESALVNVAALRGKIKAAEIIFADAIEGHVNCGAVDLIIHLRPLPEMTASTVTVQF